jgi:hypothetical protein
MSEQVTSQSNTKAVDLNKVLRWARRQMTDEGRGVLTVLDLVGNRYDLNDHQLAAVSHALSLEGWS